MIIHNILEDMVRELVADIFSDQEIKKKEIFCSCYQCRNDVMCYVLNRIDPIYVFTSRGASHFKMNYLDNLQRKADIVSLIHNGIDKIVKTKRPHFPHLNETEVTPPQGAFFNFPTITGKVIDGITFEPLGSISVLLLMGGKPAEMINPNWQNPYFTHVKTAGIYTFLPKPIKAGSENVSKVIEIELVVDEPSYEPYRRYFEIPLSSEKKYVEYYRYNVFKELEDIFIVPKQD